MHHVTKQGSVLGGGVSAIPACGSGRKLDPGGLAPQLLPGDPLLLPT